MYNQRVTGLEPVQAELNSAMLHQLHHTRINLGQVGIEPTTTGLKGRCSTPELLTHNTKKLTLNTT